MVEREDTVWLKQAWRARVTIYMVNEGAVYDWHLQQNAIKFQLTHDKAIRTCNGGKIPHSRLRLAEVEKPFEKWLWKGKNIQNVAWKGVFSRWVKGAKGHVLNEPTKWTNHNLSIKQKSGCFLQQFRSSFSESRCLGKGRCFLHKKYDLTNPRG